jgi:hypothetical protein
MNETKGKLDSESDLDQLLADATAFYDAEAQRRATMRDPHSEFFNVFRLTGWYRDEVRTHQKLLADFLNPNGTHAQGNLFLSPFLLRVSEESGILLPPPSCLWTVDNRHYVDLRLSHTDTDDRVLIEMKWDALDRDKQIVSYYRAEKRRTRKKRVAVVYITKHGGRPGYDCLELGSDLVCFSFKEDVASMLKSAVASTPSRLSETLRQYVEILELR